MKNTTLKIYKKRISCLFFLLTFTTAAHAQKTDAMQKAKDTEAKMTNDERFQLLTSLVGYVPSLGIAKDDRIPDHISMSAGYTPGIPRLNIPNLQSTDASMGITNPGYRSLDKGATAMPASILVGASFNPSLAHEAGVAIAKEARIRGFNILLAGGINLIRDVRNGRNYEYYSEDPYVTALLGAAAVNGIQSQKVISTLKHYSLNNNEVNRHWLNAIIDLPAHRETDLLAFQLAIEKSQPGSIMTGYNKINGVYASGNEYLINQVLKKEWNYKGWVMSDWGAVPNWDYILKGLDQESGIQLDVMQWGAEAFTDSLKIAYNEGKVTEERIRDAVQRILYSIYKVGVDDWKEQVTINKEKHHEIALEIARQGIVLLKNDDHILPLDKTKNLKIGVIGGYAHLGVVSGTGSGAVMPETGFSAKINIGGTGIMGGGRTLYLLPNSPLTELQKSFPNATIEYDPGYNITEAKMLANRCDIIIIFGIRVEGEGFDLADLSLPWGQDQLITELSKDHQNTIVVLQTGNPTSMPWKNNVKGIIQAWYPGQAGSTAIAEIISGITNPSGKLPLTFPENFEQTPRKEIPEIGTAWGTPTVVNYIEGTRVGYRWYTHKNETPKYAFGYGLSYTQFNYTNLKIKSGKEIEISFKVTNKGKISGADVPQIYLLNEAKDKGTKLIGFERINLKPQQSKTITITVEPRILARFNEDAKLWRIEPGTYVFGLGDASNSIKISEPINLKARTFK